MTDNHLLLIEVLVYSGYCNVPSVYLCCKRMYKLWPSRRDEVILNIIISHSEHHAATYVAQSTTLSKDGPIQWGQVQLHLTHEATYNDSYFTTCRRRSALHKHTTGYHKPEYCNVFIVSIAPMSAYIHTRNVGIHKYDVFNGIYYNIYTNIRNYQQAMKLLYDFSLLLTTYYRMILVISMDTTCVKRLLLYHGKVIIGGAEHNMIDGIPIGCDAVYPDYNPRICGLINNNIHNIIAYMRSSIIDSATFLGPQFINTCKQM